MMQKMNQWCGVFGLLFLWASFVASESIPTHVTQKADMVIFSYNRPLQLWALLESVHVYMTGLGQVQVIFRATDDRYAHAYEQVQKAFPWAICTPQGERPREDFKPLTIKASFESPHAYIIYAVDDIIVKDFVDLSTCIEILERTNAWGFYLRLGTHLSECYPCRCAQAVPPYTFVCDNVVLWQFSQAQYDWGYPHTVDMTLYRKADIEKDVREMLYVTPNSFEGCWAARRPGRPTGVCFTRSKIVNLPLNRVQHDFNNRAMQEMAPQELLERFEQGERIAIQPLFQIANKGAHMEYSPSFVMP